ncbi:hypothetical protein E2542_SST15136 [Spatholobus suberectus]|nr:hypothetical protein E2542_SST15136 [Spatholobus suberectus]
MCQHGYANISLRCWERKLALIVTEEKVVALRSLADMVGKDAGIVSAMAEERGPNGAPTIQNLTHVSLSVVSPSTVTSSAVAVEQRPSCKAVVHSSESSLARPYSGVKIAVSVSHFRSSLRV